MANAKINDLTAYTNPASTDVLPIVDVVNDATKKVSVGEVVGKITGDVDVTTDGTSSIAAGAIVDADVNANAEIAVSKLANGAARQLLQTDAAGTGVEWTDNVDIPGQCWATNTDAAYVITKSSLSTGTTTALFTLNTGGIGGAFALADKRGILEIFLDVVGDDPYDTTGAGYYVSAYKHGRSFNGLTASIAQVSATQASVTQNMTVTVSGNVATYNVVFGGFAPNHTIESVTAYIRCIHKGLTIAAA